jgi:ATP synthase protein I
MGQFALTAVIALLCFFTAGPLAAKSAALGGGINACASLAMMLLTFGSRAGADAPQIARAFYLGEGVKLAVMIAAFIVVLKTTKVAMGPMFGAYIATFFVYWVALAVSASAFSVSSAGGVSPRRSV